MSKLTKESEKEVRHFDTMKKAGRLVPHRRTIIPPLVEGDDSDGKVSSQGECYFDTRTNQFYGANGQGPYRNSSDVPRTAWRIAKDDSK
jgi:hypothetical protein